MKIYCGMFIASALLCLLITPLVISAGHRFGVYGQSEEGRKTEAMPRLGGVSIFLAFVITGALIWFALPAADLQMEPHWTMVARLLFPATLILLVGIYDDVVGASPWQKLTIEFLAAGIVWRGGIRIVVLPVLGYPIHSQLLSFLLTVFWILAATNGLNLIDGLDGLAAGVALFVTLAMFIVALIQGDLPVCGIAITIAGTLLGFLWFNSAPARIFLGDSGSLFLGFLLGALAVSTAEKSSTLLAIAVPYLAFGVPLLDTSLAVTRRFLTGRSVFAADHNHLHHKLLEKCISPRLAVAFLYGLAALFSIGSIIIVRSTQNLLVLVTVLGGVTAWILASKVRYEELAESKDYLQRALLSQRRVLANQIMIRKAANHMMKAPDLLEAWEILVRTLRALGFDEVRCRLEGWPGDLAPVLPDWGHSGFDPTGFSWSVSIPLHVGRFSVGVLQLERKLQRDRILFQFSSVLDTLISSFEEHLKSEYVSKRLSCATQYNLQGTLRFEGAFALNSPASKEFFHFERETP